jgi:guanylate kinase
MLVLSSPSGAGKTTVSRALLKSDPEINLSVSWTTRPPRLGEIDGDHYYFVDHDKFHDHVIAGNFLEYAQVFGQYYGTPRDKADETMAQGKDILFDIDWQGTQQLAQTARHDLVSIFILPPSWPELERRLRQRAQDSEEAVQYRMSRAHEEISHWAEYDYVLINDGLDKTVSDVKKILHAARLNRKRQIGLPEFIKSLNAEE